MRKLITVAAALAGMALAAPAPAAAHVSIAIGLPGFAVVAADPVPPPASTARRITTLATMPRLPSSSLDGGTTAGAMGGITAGSTSATSTTD